EGNRPAVAGDLAAGDLVARGAATIRLGSQFLQLLDGGSANRVRRTGHGMRRLAAAGRAGPRQVLAGITPDDVALIPLDAEQIRSDAMHVHDGVRAEVADAALELHAAVGLDDQQAIEPDRARRVRADRNASAAHLVADALAAARLLLFPVEDV